ncbi:MAG: aspartate aminotransferase family protein [Candidatus Abyssubacteria bacterium]
MSQDLLTKCASGIEKEYRSKTRKSREMLAEASHFVSGGVTRDTNWWRPYPVFVERGEGCKLYDIDGNEYIDYNNNFTALLLGHAHPKITAAIQEAAPVLHSAGAATESVHQWAKLICERYPSVDSVRFCCSGTEAVMFACRAARAYTNKSKIIKQVGSYHGTIPEMEVGMQTSQRGIPSHAGDDIVLADLFDRQNVEYLFEENKDDLAGLLVNGVWFSTGDDTLQFLRDLTNSYHVPLIMDEVMSYRFAMGGAQEYFGVEADISAFGKFLGGGGLACGAFGGRREIMDLFNFQTQQEPVHHAGCFAANPITVAAGITGLREMTPALLQRLNGLGSRLKQGFIDALVGRNVRGYVIGEGSLVLIGLGEPTRDPRRALTPPAQKEIMRLLGLAMLNKGNFTPANGTLWALSAPMTEAIIDKTLEDFNQTLDDLLDVMKSAAPELIAG